MALLVNFIDLFFSALTLAIIARALLSWFPIDPYNPISQILFQITEPILAPLRRLIPPIGGMMDITPIVALVIIQVLQAIVVSALRTY
ncbi:MAG: YggT family protein [Chloroflexi bacterium]|nr:YggT family protein [Chloroflexota bacterium]